MTISLMRIKKVVYSWFKFKQKNMKKLLLSIGLGVLGFAASAQTVFNVDSPSSIGGNYDFEYATTANNWGVADLTVPANSVVDTIAFVSDGTTADSLGCNALVNTGDITGKIAVVYRGDCEFGTKAKHAQDSGAVAVIIVNNVSGDPIGMLAGTDGGAVTIPVVMVSDLTGATLANAAMTEDVVVFIGNKLGRFGNDIAIDENEVIRPRYSAALETLSQSATELDIEVGAWIRNYGFNTQYNLELTCDIAFGGSSIYNNFSMVDSLESGDSVFVTLPTFSQATYAAGEYDMNYNVISDSTENFPSDNMVNSKMLINSTYISRGTVDPATGLPMVPADNYYRFTKNCLPFVDANASRIGVRGLTFSATSTRTDSLFGKFVEVRAYEWDGTDAASMSEIAYAEYDYNANLNEQNVTVDFPRGFVLADNQNYLFCVENTTSDTIYFGASEIGYGQSITTYQEYTSLFEQTNGTQSFFSDISPAISVETLPAAVASVEEDVEEELTAYPNPAVDMISIPVGNIEVKEVVIYDVTGKVVSAQNVTNANNVLRLDVTSIPNGAYVVALNLENGSTSKINVVVSK